MILEREIREREYKNIEELYSKRLKKRVYDRENGNTMKHWSNLPKTQI